MQTRRGREIGERLLGDERVRRAAAAGACGAAAAVEVVGGALREVKLDDMLDLVLTGGTRAQALLTPHGLGGGLDLQVVEPARRQVGCHEDRRAYSIPLEGLGVGARRRASHPCAVREHESHDWCGQSRGGHGLETVGRSGVGACLGVRWRSRRGGASLPGLGRDMVREVGRRSA